MFLPFLLMFSMLLLDQVFGSVWNVLVSKIRLCHSAPAFLAPQQKQAQKGWGQEEGGNKVGKALEGAMEAPVTSSCTAVASCSCRVAACVLATWSSFSPDPFG